MMISQVFVRLRVVVILAAVSAAHNITYAQTGLIRDGSGKQEYATPGNAVRDNTASTARPPATGPAAFSSGNIVVCRVGNGIDSLTTAAAPVFLDEYTPGGTLVSTLTLPTNIAGSNNALTVSGTAAGECQISRSVNTRYLIVAGYAALVGTGSPSNGTHVVGRIDANGIIDTSTIVLGMNTSSIRSGASDDGSAFWAVGGSGGVIYTPLGGESVATQAAPTGMNGNVVGIFNGQLYVSVGAGSIRLGAVGTGVPSASGNTVASLPGFPATSGAPNGFFFADLTNTVSGVDTLYVADASTSTGTASNGGVKKFSFIGGNWVYNGTFPASTTPSIPATSFYGLAGSVSGSTVTLYATRLASSPNQLLSFTDTTGFNSAPTAVPVLIATSATSTVIRGVSFAPLLAPTAASVSLGGRVLTAGGRGVRNAAVTIEGGDLTVPLTAATGSLGYYSFPGLRAGQTYFVTVRAKRFDFAEPSRAINVNGDLSDFNFFAVSQ